MFSSDMMCQNCIVKLGDMNMFVCHWCCLMWWPFSLCALFFFAIHIWDSTVTSRHQALHWVDDCILCFSLSPRDRRKCGNGGLFAVFACPLILIRWHVTRSLPITLWEKGQMLRSGRENIGMEVNSHSWVAVPSLMSTSGVLLLRRMCHILTLSHSYCTFILPGVTLCGWRDNFQATKVQRKWEREREGEREMKKRKRKNSRIRLVCYPLWITCDNCLRELTKGLAHSGTSVGQWYYGTGPYWVSTPLKWRPLVHMSVISSTWTLWRWSFDRYCLFQGRRQEHCEWKQDERIKLERTGKLLKCINEITNIGRLMSRDVTDDSLGLKALCP